jgi:FkbM family methyltransferase
MEVEKILEIHKKLNFNYGLLTDEFPEQCMSIKYIKETDTVLELGGNIGRNSCIISSILNDSSRLVVFETNYYDYLKLQENRDNNNFKFNIENSAISKQNLYQKDWIVKPENEIFIINNWNKINTSNWSDIKNKYNHLNFNVLVVDCEGGLYYILKEEPNFLETFETIIIENDFTQVSHKLFVDEEFKKNNFNLIYNKSLEDDTNIMNDCFYQVWINDTLIKKYLSNNNL